MKRFVFLKGDLGDLTDEISTRAKKKFRKKRNLNLFLNFYWKSKFEFESHILI